MEKSFVLKRPVTLLLHAAVESGPQGFTDAYCGTIKSQEELEVERDNQNEQAKYEEGEKS